MNDWTQFFPRMKDTFVPRLGQVQAFELAANVDPSDQGTIRWLIELCTAYGKTIVALGVFWILKQRGIVKAMLYLVPSDEQRKATREDVHEFNKLFGTSLKPFVVTKMARDIEVLRKGRADVFIACNQQFGAKDQFFHDLTTERHAGSWMLTLDECHHMSHENVLAIRQESISARVRLGLSATPIRADGEHLLGLPSVPNFRISYHQAWEEGAVKAVRGHEEHYDIDIEINGVAQKLTTLDLHREGEVDFEKYEAKRQLRYHQGFISPIMVGAMHDMHGKCMEHGDSVGEPATDQMVVFAMSCRHAHFVCNQINQFCQDVGFRYHAEWIGVGEGLNGQIKDDATNDRILDDFKAGKFHILVQVGKAQEGFNVKAVSVLLFLHLIGATGRLLQQIGRGLRRRAWIEDKLKDVVSVWFSADSDIGDVVDVMEDDSSGEDEGKGKKKNGGWDIWLPIPDLMVVDARRLRGEVVVPRGMQALTPEQEEFCKKFNIPVEDYLAHFGGNTADPARGMPLTPEDEGARIARLSHQVDDSLRTLCANVIRNLAKQNGRALTEVEGKKIAGIIKKAFNTRWKRKSGKGHDSMVSEEFVAKNNMIRNLQEEIRTKGIPQWMQSELPDLK